METNYWGTFSKIICHLSSHENLELVLFHHVVTIYVLPITVYTTGVCTRRVSRTAPHGPRYYPLIVKIQGTYMLLIPVFVRLMLRTKGINIRKMNGTDEFLCPNYL